MVEKLRKSVVLTNPWLPLILCVVLVGLWFTRWDIQASKFYDDDGAVVRWYTDRWTGEAWVQGTTLEFSKRSPIPPTALEGDDLREYRIIETRRAENLTKAWGCACVLSLAWLGFALVTRRESSASP